jgi:hypothetical protein
LSDPAAAAAHTNDDDLGQGTFLFVEPSPEIHASVKLTNCQKTPASLRRRVDVECPAASCTVHILQNDKCEMTSNFPCYRRPRHKVLSSTEKQHTERSRLAQRALWRLSAKGLFGGIFSVSSKLKYGIRRRMCAEKGKTVLLLTNDIHAFQVADKHSPMQSSVCRRKAWWSFEKYQHGFKDLRSDSCDRHVSLTAFGGGGARHVVLGVGQSSRSSDTPPRAPKKKKTRREPQEGQPSDAGSAP